ncbi:ABC transporter ATP-binding protein [Gottschalkia acidurici 9a]|uniref:ABC transporter ATP-binding protein n=1 Tax=Gottschalkia acidurici (strain ATCC 7906 / DSM 604 / BCRC 14475 / CIP 104303 / KCTC 5404 / NCIMB 10678 / 9a) TaxID=1128398 RepID=K0B4V8_GOTA9|nr:ABC transporter ATP-binding protein [Gottschalkia acidurici]AFS79606.1 ABC transporter ATP-binding protein [Gottschalkia acidurici 9a]
MDAIEVYNLSKSYERDQLVLNDISLSIPAGNIFGFLGPNGAGKTTLIRILNGILNPTNGGGKIMGYDIIHQRKELRSLCGVMTENAGLYENLNAIENLQFFGKMFGLSEKQVTEKSLFLLDTFNLLDSKKKKVKDFSTGMKKRLSLARTLIHSPKVLFLDEPTSGLDPESSKIVLDMVKRMAEEQRVTVFLCTHQLKYAEEICSLYGFVHRGNLLGFGTFDELLSKSNQSLKLEIKGDSIPAINKLEDLGNRRYSLPINSEKDIPNILEHIISNNGKVYEAKQVHWSLEDLYFYYQRSDDNE